MQNQLPKNWKMIPLNGIADLQGGFAFKSEDYTDKGYQLIRIANVKSGYIDDCNKVFLSENCASNYSDYILKKGDIVVSLTGNVGRIARMEQKNLPALLNQRVARFIFNNSKVLPGYIYCLINSRVFISQCTKLAKGAAQKNISNKQVLSISLPFPVDCKGEPDINEQKRIVAILEEAERLKNKRDKANRKMDELIPALFVKMFGDPVTNPMGWEKQSLVNVCEKTKLINLSKLNKEEFDYVDIASIDNTKGIINNPKRITVKNAPSRARQQLRNGDVIVSTVRPNLKNVACINSKYDGEICSTGFCIIRPKNKMVTTEYLFAIAQSEVFTKYLMSLILGANYPAVRESDIFNFNILIPPLELQNEFTDKIKEVEKQKEKQNKSANEINILFNAVIQKAFSGKL